MDFLKEVLKIASKSKYLKEKYHMAVGTPSPDINTMYTIPEITSVNIRPQRDINSLRINLVIPSVNTEHVFGGISTALNFFKQLINYSNARARIVVTDAPINEKQMVKLEGFVVIPMTEDNITENRQIVGISDRATKTLSVEQNDIFITTAWWSSYCFNSVIKQQAELFDIVPHKTIYFIQDFEHCFYPWSSRYLLADSTYRSDIPTIAIFNSGLLKDYFNNNGYKFADSYYFEPKLNEKLYECLINSDKGIKRKKQVIVYGRPSVQRNAFELVVASLKRFCESYECIEDWSFISMGEPHDPVNLAANKQLVSVGKLSLEEYANMMLESYMAISLMVSPHPSYPPLEMSTFGVKTITNIYCNKDLSEFNKNIVSLKSCNAETVASAMRELAENYNPNGETVLNPNYINNDNVFNKIVKEIINNHFSI